MNIRDLINELEDIASAHDDNVEVRLAIQPRWAFEHSIANVVEVEPTKRQRQAGEPVVAYLGEGRQIGYLSGAASVALGWTDSNNDDDDDDDQDEDAKPDHDTRHREGGDPDACPGCGCLPGEGKSAGCIHPDGCGDSARRNDDPELAGGPAEGGRS
jgi:hypothetical protein